MAHVFQVQQSFLVRDLTNLINASAKKPCGWATRWKNQVIYVCMLLPNDAENPDETNVNKINFPTIVGRNPTPSRLDIYFILQFPVRDKIYIYIHIFIYCTVHILETFIPPFGWWSHHDFWTIMTDSKRLLVSLSDLWSDWPRGGRDGETLRGWGAQRFLATSTSHSANMICILD